MTVPNAPNYEQAENDYMTGMKYKDIALKYGVSINTVKSWKKRYEWERKGVHTKEEKSVHTKNIKGCTQKHTDRCRKKKAVVEEESAVDENTDLTEKQQLFCVYFVKYLNATKAYLKVYKCSEYAARVNASKMLTNANIKKEIEKLKQNKLNQNYLEAEDIFQKYIDIAFGEVDGFCVRTQEQLKALNWLSEHIGIATEEQKARLELLKAQKHSIQKDDAESKDESVVIINDV